MITLAPPLTTTKWRKLLVFQNFKIKATKQCLNLARYHAGLDVAGFSSYFPGSPPCTTTTENESLGMRLLQFTLSGIQYKPLYTRELSQ